MLKNAYTYHNEIISGQGPHRKKDNMGEMYQMIPRIFCETMATVLVKLRKAAFFHILHLFSKEHISFINLYL